jgi:hypothetical protein
MGGPEWDEAREVIVSRDGSVLIGARTNSETMPITPGVRQAKYAGDDPHLGHGGVDVVGTSNSPDFPTTAGVFQPQLNGPRDSAVVMLKADGSGLVFSTLLAAAVKRRSAASPSAPRLDLPGRAHFFARFSSHASSGAEQVWRRYRRRLRDETGSGVKRRSVTNDWKVARRFVNIGGLLLLVTQRGFP